MRSRYSEQPPEVRAYYASLWGDEAETRWSADQSRRVLGAQPARATDESPTGLAAIEVTPAAKRAFLSLIESSRIQGDAPAGLRVRAERDHPTAVNSAEDQTAGDAPELSSLDVTPVAGPTPAEDVYQWDDILLYFDVQTAELLAGSRITVEDGSLAIDLPARGRRQRPAFSALPEPGVRDSYAHARDILGAYFGPLLLVALIQVAIAIPGAFVTQALGPYGRLLYELLVTNPLGYGGLYAVLRAVRDQRVEAEQTLLAFRSPRRYAWAVLAAVLIWMLPQAAPLLAAVVHPFAAVALSVVSWAVVTVRLSFVPYLVIEEELAPIEAIVESWRRSTGHVWRILGLYALAVPVLALGLIALIVGVIPAAALITTAHATLFASITGRTRRWLTRPVS
jgi:hypothetical protein